METNSIDPTAHDSSPADHTDESGAESSDTTETPLTAAGDRSNTIGQNKDDGVLPTPVPTDGGAPAP